MSKVDVLINGSLGEDFQLFRNEDAMQTAGGWMPWWKEASTGDPEWKNQRPSYAAFDAEGRQVQKVASPWATHTAGLLQQCPAAVGGRFRLVAECQAWSSEDEKPRSLEEASDVEVQIGIDPTGGLDPESPLIVWSKAAQPLGEWKSFEITTEAQASIITVFLRSAPALPKRQQFVLWREAHLEPLDRYRRSVSVVGAGDTHIVMEPEQPEPGEHVQALVSSARNQVFVELQARRPDNQLTAVAFKGLLQDQSRYIWRYEFAVTEAGLYDVRFVGDHGARLLAQQLVNVAEKDPVAEIAEASPSGMPRLNYRRIYVLLPPTADSKWLVSAAKGSFGGRFTIGFSADDAGIGELESRHVLAVNPHHWPETLTATWFHKNYPGTKYTAVVANSPEDLENWLRNWTGEV